MSHWNLIREKARAQRNLVLLNDDSKEVAAESLLQAADKMTGLTRQGVPAGDTLLDGGEAVLDPDAGVIWYNRDLEPEVARLYQIHEYAHYWLHGEAASCASPDINAGAFEEDLPIGNQQVEGYSPEERHEREANIFAREFLLPSNIVKRWYMVDKLGASAIAYKVGVPDGAVLHQLTYALLTVELAPDDVREKGEEKEGFALDPSQEKAAHVKHGPFLLEAGPGTGKTRTLVGRILFLLDQGIPPDSILALTSISPHWRFFQTVSPTSVAYDMTFRVYDEDGGFNGGDDHLDIFPGSGKNHELTFYPWSCEAQGNIGSFKGVFKDGMCTISVSNIGGTSGDRAEVSYTLVAFWEITYEKPRIHGYRLDYCAYWAKFCGLQAAHEWCSTTLGPTYKTATDFVKESSVYPTYVIGTGQTCNGTGCGSFTEITCTTFYDNQY